VLQLSKGPERIFGETGSIFLYPRKLQSGMAPNVPDEVILPMLSFVIEIVSDLRK